MTYDAITADTAAEKCLVIMEVDVFYIPNSVDGQFIPLRKWSYSRSCIDSIEVRNTCSSEESDSVRQIHLQRFLASRWHLQCSYAVVPIGCG